MKTEILIIKEENREYFIKKESIAANRNKEPNKIDATLVEEINGSPDVYAVQLPPKPLIRG